MFFLKIRVAVQNVYWTVYFNVYIHLTQMSFCKQEAKTLAKSNLLTYDLKLFKLDDP